MLKRYAHLIPGLIALVDILAVAGAWGIAYLMRLAEGDLRLTPHSAPTLEEFLPYMLISMLLAPAVYDRMGLYSPKRTMGLLRELTGVISAVLGVWAITYILISLMRNVPFSRLMLVSMLIPWLLLATAGRLVGRAILRRLRKRGVNLRTAVIVGCGRLGQKLHEALARNPWTGIVTAYFVDDRKGGAPVKGLQVRGPLASVEEILADHPADIVFVALSRASQETIEDVVSRLSTLNLDLRVVPNLLAVQFLRHEVSQLDDLSIISLTHSPQQGWNSLIKGVFDFFGALFALSVLAVPMLLIALAIKLTSRGPVFYRQVRASIAGQPFKIIKFRTMHVEAENNTGPVWAIPDDPRVTALGRLLRRTSMDELPQFINVLLGQMSLVGPRPERPELIERFKDIIPRYMLRHQVKAGITGWAQIHGMRGQTSLRKRIQYDLFYVRNWTFALDLWILLLTPLRSLVSPHAY